MIFVFLFQKSLELKQSKEKTDGSSSEVPSPAKLAKLDSDQKAEVDMCVKQNGGELSITPTPLVNGSPKDNGMENEEEEIKKEDEEDETMVSSGDFNTASEKCEEKLDVVETELAIEDELAIGDDFKMNGPNDVAESEESVELAEDDNKAEIKETVTTKGAIKVKTVPRSGLRRNKARRGRAK